MDGTLGKSSQSAKDTANNLSNFIDIPVCLWDERLSTIGAFNISSQLDLNVTKKEKKKQSTKIRIIGLDLGTKRIGVSICDENQSIATPLKTLIKKDGKQFIYLPICLWDERLSTIGAFNLSSQLDINVSKREKDIDKNAATFILQCAIDYLNN